MAAVTATYLFYDGGFVSSHGLRERAKTGYLCGRFLWVRSLIVAWRGRTDENKRIYCLLGFGGLLLPITII